MNNSIGTIVKKELFRFFGDKRLLFSVVIMPGIMLYIVYSLVGSLMEKNLTPDDSYIFKVSAVNMPVEIEKLLKENRCEISQVTEEKKQIIQKDIIEKKSDIYVVFPENFISDITKGVDPNIGQNKKLPEVKIFYLSTETNSEEAYKLVQLILDNVEESISNCFDVNVSNEKFDLATESDVTVKYISMLLPMLMMMLLFNGCTALAPDAIAGEKERGTIATLLVTPVKRYEIAIGKIISLSIMTFLSGLSSFLGIMFSLPKLMGTVDSVSANVYSMIDYLLLFLVVISTVLFMITVVSVISAFSSSVKEASSLMAPLNILIAISGVSGMFSEEITKKIWMYFIPLYNSAQCMNSIFSFKYQSSAVLTTIISNLIYSAVFLLVLTRMFASEKVMFSK